MATYEIIPGADYSAAPGKLGTVSFPPLDPLAMLGIPGLKAWWSAFEASIASTTLTWVDRKGGRTATRAQSTGMPTITTLAGQKAVGFNTAGMKVSPDVLDTDGWHSLFVLQVPRTAAHGVLGSAGTVGPRISIFNDGSVRGSATGGGYTSLTAGAVVAANTPVLLEAVWDPTNRFTILRNGAQVATGVGSTTATLASPSLVIGAQDESVAAGLQGIMAEAAFFDRNMLLNAEDAANLAFMRRQIAGQYSITLTS